MLDLVGNPEDRFSQNEAHITAGSDAWIGFNDIQDESLFQWTSGQQVKYTKWNINQPRQQPNTDEDCVVMTANVRKYLFRSKENFP